MNTLAQELRGIYALPGGLGRVVYVVPPEPRDPTAQARRAANEAQCAKLKKKGMTNKAIAEVTGLHYKTVAKYCRSVRYASSR